MGERDGPGQHGGGKVPGGDESRHANRLLDGPDTVAGHRGGDGITVETRSLLREPLEEVGGVGDFTPGVRQRLAVLPGD
jgi:hypothetical protein